MLFESSFKYLCLLCKYHCSNCLFTNSLILKLTIAFMLSSWMTQSCAGFIRKLIPKQNLIGNQPV